MAPSAKENQIRRYIAAYNAFDLPAMFATLSPDIHFLNYASGQVTAETEGIAAFSELAERSKGMFSEREQTVTSMAHNDDRTEVGIAFRGVLACDLPNGVRAGTVLNLNGRSTFKFSGGLICEICDYSD